MYYVNWMADRNAGGTAEELYFPSRRVLWAFRDVLRSKTHADVKHCDQDNSRLYVCMNGNSKQ